MDLTWWINWSMDWWHKPHNVLYGFIWNMRFKPWTWSICFTPTSSHHDDWRLCMIPLRMDREPIPRGIYSGHCYFYSAVMAVMSTAESWDGWKLRGVQPQKSDIWPNYDISWWSMMVEDHVLQKGVPQQNRNSPGPRGSSRPHLGIQHIMYLGESAARCCKRITLARSIPES